MNTGKLHWYLLACSIALSLTPGISLAYGTNYRNAVGFPSQIRGFNPASAEVKFLISCYNVYTGENLDCPFNSSIIGLAEPADTVENSGGHSHTNSGRDLGKLQFQSATSNQISGTTRKDVAIVTHSLPEFAGKILARTDIKVPLPVTNSPVNWYCVETPDTRCLDAVTSRFDVTTDTKNTSTNQLGVKPIPLSQVRHNGWLHFGQ